MVPAKTYAGLHARVEHDLKIAREALGHPVAKGDSSEKVWIQLFRKYLPKRYAIDKATICDSRGSFNDEIDVVVYDRQYTPLIFEHQGELIIPVESAYATFESKQEINGRFLEYAQAKLRSVRASPHERGDQNDRPPAQSGAATDPRRLLRLRERLEGKPSG